jgi:hypothetical protein
MLTKQRGMKWCCQPESVLDSAAGLLWDSRKDSAAVRLLPMTTAMAMWVFPFSHRIKPKSRPAIFYPSIVPPVAFPHDRRVPVDSGRRVDAERTNANTNLPSGDKSWVEEAKKNRNRHNMIANTAGNSTHVIVGLQGLRLLNFRLFGRKGTGKHATTSSNAHPDRGRNYHECRLLLKDGGAVVDRRCTRAVRRYCPAVGV